MNDSRGSHDEERHKLTQGLPTVTMVAALSSNNVIGFAGGMPWHLPADLRRFRQLTMGHAMIMGRRTFDSIGRALPGRRTLVVTRQTDWSRPGVDVFHTVEQALSAAGAVAMVVGGGEIYAQLLPAADCLELTRIHREMVGDTYFPEIDPDQWTETFRADYPAEQDSPAYSFLTYRRTGPTLG